MIILKSDYRSFLIKRSGNKCLIYVKSIFQIMEIISKGSFHLEPCTFWAGRMFLFLKPFIKVPVILTLHGCDIQTFKKRDGLLQKIGKMDDSNADGINDLK